MTISKKKSEAMIFLEKLTGGELSIAKLFYSFRKCENLSQTAFAKKLRISRQQVWDIENGQRFISPDLAAKYAKILGEPESQFVRIAIQDQLNRAGLKYRVEILI